MLRLADITIYNIWSEYPIYVINKSLKISSILLLDVMCIKTFETFTYQLSIVTDPQCIHFILFLRATEIERAQFIQLNCN